MVKNISGGNKTKKQRRNFGKFDAVDKISKEQMFAQIVNIQGDHFDVLCTDNVQRLGRPSNLIKRGPRLQAGAFVVVSLRDFEADKNNCDVIAIGDPPNDIKNIFKKNATKKGKADNFDFVDTDDKFKEFTINDAPKKSNDTKIIDQRITEFIDEKEFEELFSTKPNTSTDIKNDTTSTKEITSSKEFTFTTNNENDNDIWDDI
jgi:translation initiation factor IF-1